MPDYKIISCDTHIVEPPDTYIQRIEPAFRERAPRLMRTENAEGREYDAWFLDGQELITLGAFTQTALRFALSENRISCVDFAPGELPHLEEAIAAVELGPMEESDRREIETRALSA